MAASEKGTVFVIDDDASVRRSLRRLLQLSGYQVEEFASAGDFLRHERPSGGGCVILDVRLPHMTGPQLFEQMVRSGYNLPVVFLTGHGDVVTGVHAIQGGAVDFLLKPIDAEALLPAVANALRRHAAVLRHDAGRAAVLARLQRLSPREREVMEHVVRGEPNKCIAFELGISEKTVKVHRRRVMDKMEAGSLAELVRLADAATAPAAVGAGSPNGGRR